MLVHAKSVHVGASTSRYTYVELLARNAVQVELFRAVDRIMMVVIRLLVYTSLLCSANIVQAAESHSFGHGSSPRHAHVVRHRGKPKQFGQLPKAARSVKRSVYLHCPVISNNANEEMFLRVHLLALQLRQQIQAPYKILPLFTLGDSTQS
jgi:hypothetical protein